MTATLTRSLRSGNREVVTRLRVSAESDFDEIMQKRTGLERGQSVAGGSWSYIDVAFDGLLSDDAPQVVRGLLQLRSPHRIVWANQFGLGQDVLQHGLEKVVARLFRVHVCRARRKPRTDHDLGSVAQATERQGCSICATVTVAQHSVARLNMVAVSE
jgi:hypothetical protein